MLRTARITPQLLHNIYVATLAVWPGVALMSLGFIPAAKTVWWARLPEGFIVLELCVLLAAIAIYLVFITEVLHFSHRWFEATITTLILPAHTLVVVLIAPQTIWESIILGAIMECGVVLVGVGYLVIEKIVGGDWNTFSIVVLIGTVGLFLAAVIPLLLAIVEHNWQVYLLTGAAAVVGSIQVITHFKTKTTPTLRAEPYIILGIVTLLVLPLAGWLVVAR